jgi:ParB-like chromosome segregation protein Spo0J
MAQAPASAIAAALQLRPDEITVGDRLRPVDPVWARALGAIMAADGQHRPIEVCRLPGKKGYLLVAGAHRLEGAKLAGLPTVAALVVSADKAERRAREISENLWRADLAPLDRSAFVAELVTLKKVAAGVDPDADGRAISAAVRWQKALAAESGDAKLTVSLAYGFTDEVAEQVGVSIATIKRDLLLHRRLLPDVAEQLRAHPVGRNGAQLKALAKLDPAPQRAVATMLVDGTARSVADALAVRDQRTKRDPRSYEVLSGRVKSTLRRLREEEQTQLIEEIAGMFKRPFANALQRINARQAAK